MENFIKTGKIYDQAASEINDIIDSVKGLDFEKLKYRLGSDGGDLRNLYETFCEESDLTIDSKISYDAFYAFINS